MRPLKRVANRGKKICFQQLSDEEMTKAFPPKKPEIAKVTVEVIEEDSTHDSTIDAVEVDWS